MLLDFVPLMNTSRSVSQKFLLPSVIVLKNYHSRPDRIPVMSRKNVYYRDNFCCQVALFQLKVERALTLQNIQYCLQNFEKNQKGLSLDHLVPRSKGGKLTWLNTVTACNGCNFKKGSTLPEDLPKLGMKLRNLPRIPSYAELQYKAKKFSRTQTHPHWEHFI